MALQLTPRERKALKARAHALEPRVQIGNAGVTGKVITEIDRALAAHELIKVKILNDDRDEREAMAAEITERTNSAEVTRVGKVLIVWRPKPADDSTHNRNK